MPLLSIIWDIDPVIFALGPLQLRWYGLMWALGIYLCYWVNVRLYAREKWPADWTDHLFTWLVCGTIIGSRLGHCLFYEWHDGVNPYLLNPIRMLYVWEGGLASHGGAIGLIITSVIVYVRYMRATVTARYGAWGQSAYNGLIFVMDRLCIGVCLCGAAIRLGNLMNSEIYGGPTTMPWGFVFVRDGQTVPCHPTQIYEMLYCLVGFAITYPMFTVARAYRRPGLIFGTFLICIFLTRFLLEFIKNNQEAFEDSLTLNMGQILSIPFILWGFICIYRALRAPAIAE